MKAAGSETVSPPVWTVKLARPGSAVGLTVRSTVSDVGLRTCTAPVLIVPPPGIAAKLTVVEFGAKWVPLPVIVAVSVCPCRPEAGETEDSAAGLGPTEKD